MSPGVRKMILAVCAGAFLVSLLPMPSQAGADIDRATMYEPDLYVLYAAPLGLTGDSILVRFEYYRDQHLLETDVVQLGIGGSESVLVPIPPSMSSLLMQLGDQEIRLQVFANDLLVDQLDHESLRQRSTALLYTHGRELASMTGLTPGDVENIDCGDPPPGACSNWGCSPNQDYDCDGVKNFTDNCNDEYNPNQADCDGDGFGNVCDGLNGIFQPTGPTKTCMTDKDNHVVYKTFEHHVERRLVDVSNCNSPDRWNRWVRSDGSCTPSISDFDCCRNGIGTSIRQVGDDEILWCGSGRRDQDFCH